jgi:hypothetical protein
VNATLVYIGTQNEADSIRIVDRISLAILKLVLAVLPFRSSA